MDDDELTTLLDSVRSGTVAPDDAAGRLRRLPFADLGFARVDHHRHVRQGLPEAVYGPGKSPEQCAAIVAELLEHGTGP
ncbi:MAG: nickel pincer cofactor biosynthesis protein LarB, partial [Acidimicrobiales bacterium]